MANNDISPSGKTPTNKSITTAISTNKSASNRNHSYKKLQRPPYRKMLLKLAKVAIPAMLSQAFAFYMEIVNLFFIGHLNDPEKVAGVGLGNMYVNIVC